MWSEALRLTGPIVKRCWLWISFIFLFDESLDYAIHQWHDQPDAVIICCYGVVFLLDLVLSGILVIIVNQALEDVRIGGCQSLAGAVSKYLKYVFIESTRALLPIFSKGLLLIIPGVIEFVRLYFIPYVVQLDGRYNRGEIDALEASRQLVKGRTAQVMLVLLLMFIISAFPRFLMDYSWPGVPGFISWTVSFVIAVAAEVFTDAWIYLYYRRLNHESLLSQPQAS